MVSGIRACCKRGTVSVAVEDHYSYCETLEIICSLSVGASVNDLE